MSKPDAYGHVTRFSDSSFYDEICVNCGATDARGDNRLNGRCPKPPHDGGMSWDEYEIADAERIERLNAMLKGEEDADQA